MAMSLHLRQKFQGPHAIENPFIKRLLLYDGTVIVTT